jgi:hypothetical protein
MLVLLVNRGYNDSNYWFWVPLVGSLRKIPITHYKPNSTGGADDILQLEHTGIYKIQYEINSTYTGPELSELENTIQSIFSLQGYNNLNLDDQTKLQNAYEAINKLIPLFTACSAGRITSATNGDTILQYDITGWADAAGQTNTLTFAKLNIYTHQSDSSNIRVGLLSIPNDAKQVKVINITKTTQNNIDTYGYTELINATINNSINISNIPYSPNTLNLHLYIGETTSIKITQQSTYVIDNKTKSVTQHIYPPTVHGYGTTLMPTEKNTMINSMSEFINLYGALSNSEKNMLFYDVLS